MAPSFTSSVVFRSERMPLMRSIFASMEMVCSFKAASMAPIFTSSVVFTLLSTCSMSASLFSMDRVCAFMAASMAASLALSVLLTDVMASMMTWSLVCWSAFILSIADTSMFIACSFLSVPLFMASTTLVKSFATVTSILYFSRVPSSSQELKNSGVASSIAPANKMDFNVLIVLLFWVIVILS